MRCLRTVAVLCAVASTTAQAAPRVFEPYWLGRPLVQTHLGDRLSQVDDGERRACVATAGIDISASRYLEPDGAETPFEAVRRSRAAHVSVTHDTVTPVARISLKYTVDPAAPVSALLDGREIDMSDRLDPSGDVISIADPTIVRLMLEGRPMALTARSQDTGRTVIDAIPPIDASGLDDCVASLAGAASGMNDGAPPATINTADSDIEPEASMMIGLRLLDPGIGAPTLHAEHAAVCGLEDETRPIQEARLLETRGFFSQIGRALVIRDEGGSIVRVYVQGIFDAQRSSEDEWRVTVSKAADAIDPFGPARVSGCIGASTMALCGMSADGGALELGECFGELLAGDPFGDDPALVPVASPKAFASPRIVASPTVFSPLLGAAPFLSPTGQSRGPSVRGVDSSSDTPPDAAPPIPAIPLPPAGALLASAIALPAALRLRRARAQRLS